MAASTSSLAMMVSATLDTRFMASIEASPSTPKTSSQMIFQDSSSKDDEMKGTKRKISLSKCGVCGVEEAKYNCPACLKRSCSLPCVKKHKEKSRCSGVRNKTAFLKVSHMDEMALLSDYRFLEDTGRIAGCAQRDNLISIPYKTNQAKKLTVKARMMNITLKTLPSTFTRRKENSTIFRYGEKVFMWHLKILFPQSGTEFSQRRVCDGLTLEEILTAYIHPTDSDPVIRQKLKRYVLNPTEEVNVFMKAEGSKANSVRYHKLDLRKSLRDNLINKTLIEYPILHVVLRDHWKDFPLEGSVEPASAGNNCETKSISVGQASEDLPLRSPSLHCPQIERENIFNAIPSSIHEPQPPLEKKAKRELGELQLEEGEIPDGED
ncbi:box C/D snoRNA protein 1 [Stigmatopora nigra]